jgi:hypothetical protein
VARSPGEMCELICGALSRSRQWRQRGDQPFSIGPQAAFWQEVARPVVPARRASQGRGRGRIAGRWACSSWRDRSPKHRRFAAGGRPSLARRAGDGFAGSLLCHGESRRILTRGLASITRSVMATVGGTGVSPVRAAKGPAIFDRPASRVLAGGGVARGGVIHPPTG